MATARAFLILPFALSVLGGCDNTPTPVDDDTFMLPMGNDDLGVGAIVDEGGAAVLVVGQNDKLQTHTRWFVTERRLMNSGDDRELTIEQDGWSVRFSYFTTDASSGLNLTLTDPDGEKVYENITVDDWYSGPETRVLFFAEGADCRTGAIAWGEAEGANMEAAGAGCDGSDKVALAVIDLTPTSLGGELPKAGGTEQVTLTPAGVSDLR